MLAVTVHLRVVADTAKIMINIIASVTAMEISNPESYSPRIKFRDNICNFTALLRHGD